MAKTPLRTLGFALASMFMVLFSTLALSGTAFASTKAAASTAPHVTVQQARMQSPCHALLVHLHGTLPATTTCLDRSTTGKVNPSTSVDSDCSNSNAVWIYWDANWQGACIGFIGSGLVNMTDWDSCHNAFQCFNWNDQASSFITGCSAVEFYVDIDGNGRSALAESFEAENFPFGGVGNDQLSSVRILHDC